MLGWEVKEVCETAMSGPQGPFPAPQTLWDMQLWGTQQGPCELGTVHSQET